MLSKSEEYRANARNCSELAAEAKNLPSKNRYKRMHYAYACRYSDYEIMRYASQRRREI